MWEEPDKFWYKMPPVVKVSMGEDAINPATNRTKLCNAAFLKGIAMIYYQHGVVLTHNNHYISNEDCCSPWWRLCWGSTCCCSEGRPPRPKCAECNLRCPCSYFCFSFRSCIFFDSPIAGHSFGVLCAAHRNIHCSVAVIWKQVTIVTWTGKFPPLYMRHFYWVTFYLGASFWFAFGLKLHCQTVEFHAKLPKIKGLRWWVWVGKKHP